MNNRKKGPCEGGTPEDEGLRYYSNKLETLNSGRQIREYNTIRELILFYENHCYEAKDTKDQEIINEVGDTIKFFNEVLNNPCLNNILNSIYFVAFAQNAPEKLKQAAIMDKIEIKLCNEMYSVVNNNKKRPRASSGEEDAIVFKQLIECFDDENLPSDTKIIVSDNDQKKSLKKDQKAKQIKKKKEKPQKNKQKKNSPINNNISNANTESTKINAMDVDIHSNSERPENPENNNQPPPQKKESSNPILTKSRPTVDFKSKEYQDFVRKLLNQDENNTTNCTTNDDENNMIVCNNCKINYNENDSHICQTPTEQNNGEQEAEIGEKEKEGESPSDQNNKRKNKINIYVEIEGNWVETLEDLKYATGVTPEATLVGKMLKIEVNNDDDFRSVQKYLLKNNVKFQTLDPRQERPKKFLFRGIPVTTPKETIEEFLKEKGYQPLKIAYLTNRRTKTPMPLYMIACRPTPNLEDIFSINTFNFLKIEVTEFRAPKVKQCYNCQGYGHSSLTCYLSPKCVRCAGAHTSKNCNLNYGSDELKCANCGEPHPANFRGCVKNPFKKNRNLNAPALNKYNKTKQTNEATKQNFIPAPPPSTNAWARPIKTFNNKNQESMQNYITSETEQETEYSQPITERIYRNSYLTNENYPNSIRSFTLGENENEHEIGKMGTTQKQDPPEIRVSEKKVEKVTRPKQTLTELHEETARETKKAASYPTGPAQQTNNEEETENNNYLPYFGDSCYLTEIISLGKEILKIIS